MLLVLSASLDSLGSERWGRSRTERRGIKHMQLRSGRRNLGPILPTHDTDVGAWPARFRTGFDKFFAGIPVGVSRSLNYRSRPPHSFRLVLREPFEYSFLQLLEATSQAWSWLGAAQRSGQSPKEAQARRYDNGFRDFVLWRSLRGT